MIRYLSTSDIAEWFGVDSRTVVKWRERYPDFPRSDAEIGRVCGWLPDREQDIRAWEAGRRGQGWRAGPTESTGQASGT